MVKITIDGKELEVDPQLTVIQAAARNGIEIPHFCWHPRLTVSGNCRMCLVEIEKMSKLAISCATQVANGMVVKTRSEKVIKARNARTLDSSVAAVNQGGKRKGACCRLFGALARGH